MHKQSLLFAVAFGIKLASADFLIVTEPIPVPTPTVTNPSTDQLISFQASVSRESESLFATKYSSLFHQKVSMGDKVAIFAASATTFGIPAEVTDDSKTTTFSSAPAWFTALPKDVQDYKNAEVSAIRAIALEIQPTGPGTENSSAPANETRKADPLPTASKTGEPPKPSSAANARAVGMGAGLLAVVGAGLAFL